jgi:hypothetical protein
VVSLLDVGGKLCLKSNRQDAKYAKESTKEIGVLCVFAVKYS